MQFGKQLGLIDRRPHLGASRETRDGMAAELMAVLGLHSVRTALDHSALRCLVGDYACMCVFLRLREFTP